MAGKAKSPDGMRKGLIALRRIDWNGVAAFQPGHEIPAENELLDNLVDGEDYEERDVPDLGPRLTRADVDQGDNAPGLVDHETGAPITQAEHAARKG